MITHDCTCMCVRKIIEIITISFLFTKHSFSTFFVLMVVNYIAIANSVQRLAVHVFVVFA